MGAGRRRGGSAGGALTAGKRRLFPLLLCLLWALVLCPVSARADTGPKPAIYITFENMGGQDFYGTLLTPNDRIAAFHAWDGESDYYDMGNAEMTRESWEKFIHYQDPDGFYYLQYHYHCSEHGTLNWLYYAPQTFKLLLYFPETDVFFVSGSYERTSYTSYYTVDLSGLDPAAGTGSLAARKLPVPISPERVTETRQLPLELARLGARMALTILVEALVAEAFHLWRGKLRRWIVLVNIVTQLMLNWMLYGVAGAGFDIDAYFMLAMLPYELPVLLLEFAAYYPLFRRLGEDGEEEKALGYTLAANIASFVTGVILAGVAPALF